jgi:hypothetical protein
MPNAVEDATTKSSQNRRLGCGRHSQGSTGINGGGEFGYPSVWNRSKIKTAGLSVATFGCLDGFGRMSRIHPSASARFIRRVGSQAVWLFLAVTFSALLSVGAALFAALFWLASSPTFLRGAASSSLVSMVETCRKLGIRWSDFPRQGDPAGVVAFIDDLTFHPIPEPISAGLLGLGLFRLLAMRLRHGRLS